jgi:hypothetical protein
VRIIGFFIMSDTTSDIGDCRTSITVICWLTSECRRQGAKRTVYETSISYGFGCWLFALHNLSTAIYERRDAEKTGCDEQA